MREKIKLVYGTHNLAKLEAMRNRLSCLGIEIMGLDQFCALYARQKEIPAVAEDGNTPLENARKKALSYYRALHVPVFSCDSGLYIDNIPEEEQPGVHVRTVNGRYLTDEEMVEHYTGLAAKYGNLTARYRNAVCLVLDENRIYEAMEKSMESEPFLITSYSRPVRKKGFPLDSLSVDIKTGKYYYDLEDGALDQVAVEDGFLEFFQKVLKEL